MSFFSTTSLYEKKQRARHTRLLIRQRKIKLPDKVPKKRRANIGMQLGVTG